jgi:oxygen-independent coproporphyrinogen III oxidase
MNSPRQEAPADHPTTRSPDPPIPSGIYVHLPYCRSRCGYCAFVVSTDDSSAGAYRRALERETAHLADEARGAGFDSVYLGGGTPSLTPAPDLAVLLEDIRRRFDLLPSPEITLEANPEDVTPEAARDWRDAGITRVSVGVQSFEDGELSAVGRRHDASRARAALEILERSGFALSGDLILGLPGQTPQSFRASLASLCESGAGHVSVYLLEAEKSRTIEADRRLHPSRYLSDDAQADVWLEMGETLAHEGFSHYEISNWALPGRESRHNVKYWRRTPTLGLGVSAHEFWDGRRRANVSSLPRYVEEMSAGRRPLAMDVPVAADEAARERIVLGLRLSEGVPTRDLEDWIQDRADAILRQDYAAWREERLLLEEAPGRTRFSERGFLVSNEILCRFV